MALWAGQVPKEGGSQMKSNSQGFPGRMHNLLCRTVQNVVR